MRAQLLRHGAHLDAARRGCDHDVAAARSVQPQRHHADRAAHRRYLKLGRPRRPGRDPHAEFPVSLDDLALYQFATGPVELARGPGSQLPSRYNSRGSDIAPPGPSWP